MKPDAIIIDIDGTIADNSHRQHFLLQTPRDWCGFFGGITNDKPYSARIDFITSVVWNLDLQPLFVTGRRERYRDESQKWINEHVFPNTPYNLFMRPEDNFSFEHEIKKRIYFEKIIDNWNVILVLDDGDTAVDMWRSLGLECWQTQGNTF